MGLGSIIGSMIAGAGKITAAAANKNKNNNKGSSSSSGSSSKPSGSSGGKGSNGYYQYGNKTNDSGKQTISQADADAWSAGAKQAADNWHLATTAEDKQYWHDVATNYNTKLGKSYDDSTGKWSGGYTIKQENPYLEGDAADYYDRADDLMWDAQDQTAAANQAKVDSAITDLNAQKGKVGDLTAKNNAAAEQAYMQTVNPNGSLAENLARAGLLPTGLTESSQISAGNSYQDALNQNATTQTEALAEIERAITKAQLEGDLATAEALSGLLAQIAQQGIDRADKIAGWNQWQQQFNYDKGVTDAGITGVYNGQTTIAGQQAQDQHELNQLEAESKRLANELNKKYGVPLQELELELMRLQKEGYTLDNAYKALENKYAKSQFGG